MVYYAQAKMGGLAGMKRAAVSIVVLIFLSFIGCKNTDDSTSSQNLVRITGMNPGVINPGQEDIEGRVFGSNFVGVQSVNLGDGVVVLQFSTISASEIYIFFSVSRDAVPGPRNIIVATGTGAAESSTVFTIGDNVFPVADFKVSPGFAYRDTLLRFDASRSNDPDGGITNYHWKFGDGKQDRGKVVTHKYGRPGDFSVRLTVTDNRGASTEVERFLNVAASKPPLALFSMNPSTGDLNTVFHFDASASRDPDGKITQYNWGFGDGQAGHGVLVDHKFARGGDIPVTLTVLDDTGVHAFSTKIARISGGGGPPPPPPNGGSECTGGLQKGPGLYGTILSVDDSNHSVIVQLYDPGASCGNAFYRCGDIRQGGDPNPPEFWFGTICRMIDLGNNTFQIFLTAGKTRPVGGEQNVYLWPQDCSGGVCQ